MTQLLIEEAVFMRRDAMRAKVEIAANEEDEVFSRMEEMARRQLGGRGR